MLEDKTPPILVPTPQLPFPGPLTCVQANTEFVLFISSSVSTSDQDIFADKYDDDDNVDGDKIMSWMVMMMMMIESGWMTDKVKK